MLMMVPLLFCHLLYSINVAVLTKAPCSKRTENKVEDKKKKKKSILVYISNKVLQYNYTA